MSDSTPLTIRFILHRAKGAKSVSGDKYFEHGGGTIRAAIETGDQSRANEMLTSEYIGTGNDGWLEWIFDDGMDYAEEEADPWVDQYPDAGEVDQDM